MYRFSFCRFWSNKRAVIGTFTSLGLVVITAIILVLFWVSRRRKRSTSKVEPVDPLESGTAQPPNRTLVRPFSLKYEAPATDLLNIKSSQRRSNHQLSSNPIQFEDSNPTTRQVRLQEEADDLKQRIWELQHSLNSSNDGMHGMQLIMAGLVERIQLLESQSNSDWARGLTDEPPPEYRTIYRSNSGR
ncbi:hypothetical protein VKT23_014361 [Stygiomarasmius scandens]|uniref:Uncharacterized protein n=1 Tax=Marasmiellus scandens TaxID=2682957 RepID=A0ABR1J3X7_9AGAR